MQIAQDHLASEVYRQISNPDSKIRSVTSLDYMELESCYRTARPYNGQARQGCPGLIGLVDSCVDRWIKINDGGNAWDNEGIQ